eukprot:6195026-Prymnesium_polylepis.1
MEGRATLLGPDPKVVPPCHNTICPALRQRGLPQPGPSADTLQTQVVWWYGGMDPVALCRTCIRLRRGAAGLWCGLLCLSDDTPLSSCARSENHATMPPCHLPLHLSRTRGLHACRLRTWALRASRWRLRGGRCGLSGRRAGGLGG